MCFVAFLNIIMSESLLHHFMSHNLLSSYQFEFLPGRSSCSQLLSAINHWFTSFDDLKSIHIVYTDIAKAFDTVSHTKLLSVLSSMGVSSKVLSCIKCFLYDRVQCVCVNNHFSSYSPVLRGVPQGSILVATGPLLFVAYIDEGVKISNLHGTSNGTDMYLYADDAKLFSNNIDNLQSALKRLSAWLCSCQLNLAPAKCEHVHISRSNNSLDHSFQLCSHSIKTIKTVKDLGVLISYRIILNGLNISITFILLLPCVLIRSCVLFLIKMFGPCLKVKCHEKYQMLVFDFFA